MEAKHIRALWDARNGKVTELRSLADGAMNRSYTASEFTTDDRLNGEIRDLDTRIAAALEEGEHFEALGVAMRALNLPDGSDRSEPVTPGVELRALLSGVTLTTSGTTGPAVAPADRRTKLVDHLSAASIFLASGVLQDITDRQSVAYPRLTSDGAAGFVAEGEILPTSAPAVDLLTVTPRKLAYLAYLSNELANDSSPAALEVWASSMLRTLALRFDLAAYEGDGAGNSFVGLKNTPGITNVSLGANGAALSNLDPFADALGQLTTAGANPDRVVFAMHPGVWQSASKLKETTSSAKPLLQESAGSGAQGIVRSIYGRPVFLSSQLSTTETQGTATATASVYAYDVDQVIAVIRQGATFEKSGDAGFDHDSIGVRAIMRAAIAVPNAAAAARIAGIKLS